MLSIKTVIYSATFCLAVTASSSAAYGSERGTLPHVDGAVQFPETRAKRVRHTLRLHIPRGSSSVSQLTVNVPNNLIVRDDIEVVGQSSRQVDANISVNGRTINIAFSKPVAPDTQLNINLNRVLISGVSNAWSYPVSAFLTAPALNLPIGIAQLPMRQ